MAVTLDLRHKVIRIVFKKPIDWIGLDLETARALRDKLSEHIETLEHVRVIE
jgi:glucose-6-phosphate 1-dehydrogenase